MTSSTSSSIPNTEFTLRTSALRIESPVLKQDAVYYIRCSRRDFTSLTQFSATARFGVATFRGAIQPSSLSSSASASAAQRNNNNKRNSSHHERTFSSIASPEVSAANFQHRGGASSSSSSFSFPARESLFWERPACLVHFKPTTDDDQKFASKLLKIEIIETLFPSSSSPKRGTSIEATSSSSSLFDKTATVIGSVEVDLSVFLPGGAKHDDERMVKTKQSQASSSSEENNCHHHCQIYVIEYKIPVRFGEDSLSTNVGGDIFMSFRFDAGDDRSKTPLLSASEFEQRNKPSSLLLHNNHEIQDGEKNKDSNKRKSQQQEGIDDENNDGDSELNNKTSNKAAVAAPAASSSSSKNNTSGKAISTVLPPVNSAVSAIGVLQDLLNMLSEERQEEPILIKQINELTERRKMLVLNNFLGGDSPSPSPSSLSPLRSSPAGDMFFGGGKGATEKMMIEECQDRLATATAELLRVVTCDRIVMMYRSGLKKALSQMEDMNLEQEDDGDDSEQQQQEKEEEEEEESSNRNGNDDDDDDISPVDKKVNARKIRQEDLERAREEAKNAIAQLQRSTLWSQAIDVMESKQKKE